MKDLCVILGARSSTTLLANLLFSAEYKNWGLKGLQEYTGERDFTTEPKIQDYILMHFPNLHYMIDSLLNPVDQMNIELIKSPWLSIAYKILEDIKPYFETCEGT